MEKSEKRERNLPAPRVFDPMKPPDCSNPGEREAAYSKIFSRTAGEENAGGSTCENVS